MRAPRRKSRKRTASAPARWRESCVDGVLHAAYAAAAGAEAAAHRCTRSLARRRGAPAGRGPLRRLRRR